VAADPRAHDRPVGLAIAALAVAVGWTARAFPDVPGQKLGASTLPLIVAAGLLACGLLLVLRSLRARRPDGAAPAAADERIGPALGILAAIGLYLAGADALGYLVVAPLSLLVAMRALGVRWPRAIGGSVVAALAVHLAFYKLLKVPLPWGVVPVLY
jgi:putative tricarboxylic transport membrane protein